MRGAALARRRLGEMTALPSFDLAGQVALVTGASSGIGRHLALLLAAAGAKVALAARRTDLLAEAAREIEAEGGTRIADRARRDPPRQRRRRRRRGRAGAGAAQPACQQCRGHGRQAGARTHRGRLGLRARHQSQRRLADMRANSPRISSSAAGRDGSSTSPRCWRSERSRMCRAIAPPRPGSST